MGTTVGGEEGERTERNALRGGETEGGEGRGGVVSEAFANLNHPPHKATPPPPLDPSLTSLLNPPLCGAGREGPRKRTLLRRSQ